MLLVLSLRGNDDEEEEVDLSPEQQTEAMIDAAYSAADDNKSRTYSRITAMRRFFNS